MGSSWQSIQRKSWTPLLWTLCETPERLARRSLIHLWWKDSLNETCLHSKKVVSKDKAKVRVLKQDLALLSKLYISCKTRDGNLEEFFKFQPSPPSLSETGQLRGGQKADLIKSLPDSSSQCTTQPAIDAAILDGAVIVQMLKPGTAQTFEDYFKYVFAPYIARGWKQSRD